MSIKDEGCLAIILLIKITLYRQLKGLIKSATISRHSSGKYYISLLCKEEVSELPKSNSAVGIDLGITDFAILSDGQKFDNNQFTSKMEKNSNVNNVSCQDVPY
ncbi:transposase [Enterococcus sp. DIV0436]